MLESKPEYFKIALSTSIAVFGFYQDQLVVLLGNKPHNPFLGAPTLPTSWVEHDKDVTHVAKNVLTEAFGENDLYIEQLNAFAKLYRKPEGRVVNIAHYSLASERMVSKPLLGDYRWVPINEVPTLVYDHNEILEFARERLKRRVKHRPIGFHLLPQEFTFKNIHALYEQSLGKSLDKRNFRKKLLKSKLLVELDKSVTEDGSKKPSMLYSFNEAKYEKLTLKGYDFKF